MNAHSRFGDHIRRSSTCRRHARLASLGILFAMLICALASAARAEHFMNDDFGRRTNITTGTLHSHLLNRSVHYSIYLPPSYFAGPDRRFPVIYYFHGFDARGTAYEDWLTWHLDETLDRLIAEGRVQETIVAMPECFSSGIVVNWGRRPRRGLRSAVTFPLRLLRGAGRSMRDSTYLGTFLFFHRRDLPPADYADFFTTEFIRYIEDNYRTADGRNSRALCGFSTGGYSSLSVAFQHPDLFGSVSAHAPMLITGSPFSTEAEELFVEFDLEQDKFIPQRFTINLLRRIFADNNTWIANNPIDIARERSLDGLSVYIDVARGDKRKYDTGAEDLVKVLKDKGVRVRFEVVEGLPPRSNHTYPGFLNGRFIAKHTRGMSERELRALFGWKNVRALVNPDVQEIEKSLAFHSTEFSLE